jgi:esterase/lipase
MSMSQWWWTVFAAFMGGLVIGGWFTLNLTRKRFDARARRTADELQQKYGSTADQLRAAQVRAQNELDQVRNSFKRQLAAASDEPRASVARAEERLKAAYAEIDRLRAALNAAPDTDHSTLTDGFAATRPMREGL